MLHPSYTELIAKANEGVEPGDEPVVQSRYSIVCATAKRARQLVDEANKNSDDIIVEGVAKPLSDAVMELDKGKIYIMTEEEYADARNQMEEEVAERVAARIAAKEAAASMAALEKENSSEEEDDEVIDFDSDDEDDDEGDDGISEE